MAWEPVIGLEVHAQLLTASKLFCGCSTRFGAAPNTNVCPVCLGMPGALPVTNRKAVQIAIRVGLALGCTVRPTSVFARKNYFYPDLPKGYQISQYELPIDEHGVIEIDVGDVRRRVRVVRAHLEEDAGKNVHLESRPVSLVDCNRTGVPLLEIVTGPDLRSAQEASTLLEHLREILMALGANDGNLEEGSFRCDANVSVRRAGDETLGTRTELKNINSFKFVRNAIDHEIARQIAVLEGGGTLRQETRTWNDARGETTVLRTKEEADDYRYFPDPDLPPLVVDPAWIEEIRAGLPELPAARRARFVETLGLSTHDAGVLTSHQRVAEYFEVALASGGDPLARGKPIANWVVNAVLGATAFDALDARFPVPPETIGELQGLVERGELSLTSARKVLDECAATGATPARVVEEGGLRQVSDVAALEAVCQKVVAEHPRELAELRGGKDKLFGFFVGQVMRATKGQANPQVVNDVLRRLLQT
ncbi:MAG: Asp-tRNA(Asn)/Glu-tRNA(Gln) amidotransferase subunit GatB [Micrococcales bacterium]|nr:Asp-tRNA(Asn)/Glu-tRNA(Gln) amidotransferase subunit GatB [Micrococcales bacterium]